MCVTTQGEDVVAGIRTPEPIERLSETLPEAYAQLIQNCDFLEAHDKDMQVRGRQQHGCARMHVLHSA
jgi:phosphoenolpyruvate synthase/pyruvate phosphate dikinase